MTLAVLTGAPLAAMGADGGAPAVLALAPLAVMPADARAPAVLALAPSAVMRADARGGAKPRNVCHRAATRTPRYGH